MSTVPKKPTPGSTSASSDVRSYCNGVYVGWTFLKRSGLLSFLCVRKKHKLILLLLASQIRIQHLLTEEGLVKRSTEFEEAIAGGERSALRNFCESKASSAM